MNLSHTMLTVALVVLGLLATVEYLVCPWINHSPHPKARAIRHRLTYLETTKHLRRRGFHLKQLSPGFKGYGVMLDYRARLRDWCPHKSAALDYRTFYDPRSYAHAAGRALLRVQEYERERRLDKEEQPG